LNKKSKKILLACILFIGVGYFLLNENNTFISKSSSEVNVIASDITDSNSPYEINELGLTYGSSFHAETYDDEPDLIEAYSTDWELGYVKKTELDDARNTKGIKEISIPVYEKDGITIIGEFIVLELSE
jgi:hypothetical protein